jgi:hypothetical protein
MIGGHFSKLSTVICRGNVDVDRSIPSGCPSVTAASLNGRLEKVKSKPIHPTGLQDLRLAKRHLHLPVMIRKLVVCFASDVDIVNLIVNNRTQSPMQPNLGEEMVSGIGGR